jgi:hypothetical protein
MRSIIKTSLIATFIGFGVATVAAQPYAPPPPASPVISGNVVQAAMYYKKHHHKKWVWSAKYGPRYRHKRHGYVYYYEGWYYPRPYWHPGVSIHLGM